MIADDFRIEPLPPYFDRWPELLDLIRRSFAYMDGMIDPPSSAGRLTVEGLRRKAVEERCFIAMSIPPSRQITPTPNPSPQGGGGPGCAKLSISELAEAATGFPSPLWGGVRGGGDVSAEPTQILGCVFVAERADHFYVGKLAVELAMQGKGVGRALVGAVEAMARAAGKPALELQTRVELAGNQVAFAKLGFRETARTAHAGYDQPTSITLRKALA